MELRQKEEMSLEKLDDIFKRCAQRAAKYDKENSFFNEDFEELKQAGYLLMPVPKELGGFGMNLYEVDKIQRRLAYHAAPTALGLNMHLLWVGMVADLWRRGDKSLEWVLTEAARGHVFAAGHAETGNHISVLYSTTKAVKVEGGYTFTGHKSFGSLSPVWTYLGLYGMDNSDPGNPKIVHAFLPRNTEGSEIKQTWDNVLGMRATRSDDTILNNAFVPNKYVARIVPTGFKGIDAFVVTGFIWALMGFANTYCGLAENAFDLILSKIKDKKSIAFPNGMRNHPYVQSEIAKMYMKLESIRTYLDSVTLDWANGVDYGQMWGLKIVNAKRHAVEKAFEVVRTALELSGGFGIFPESGIERLYRDASLGFLHTANGMLTEDLTGGALCGSDLDGIPRWG